MQHAQTIETATDRRRRPRVDGATQAWIFRDDQAGNDPWEVRVVNVSRHGVGFESSEKMRDGEECRIRIGRGPLKLARRIRVVRCRPGHENIFNIGGEFL